MEIVIESRSLNKITYVELSIAFEFSALSESVVGKETFSTTVGGATTFNSLVRVRIEATKG